MIKIDVNKCTLCNKCVEVCAAETLVKSDDEILQIKPENCVVCGHCAVICPVDAITTAEESRLKFIAKQLKSDNSEIENLLLTKRSVREFKDEKISKEILEKIIFYAEKAPSSSNKRKREYIVVTQKSKIFELEKAVVEKFNSIKIIFNPFVLGIINVFSKKTALKFKKLHADIEEMNTKLNNKTFKIFRNAPVVVFYIAPTKEVQSKDDCVISQQYSMLYAENVDVGSCIIGYAQYAHKALEKVLNIEKGKTIFAVSTFGYAKYKLKKEVLFSDIFKMKLIS